MMMLIYQELFTEEKSVLHSFQKKSIANYFFDLLVGSCWPTFYSLFIQVPNCMLHDPLVFKISIFRETSTVFTTSFRNRV